MNFDARIALAAAINGHDGCWEWPGSPITGGYGGISLMIDGKRVTKKAHRVAYERIRGPIPNGMHLDHLCRNRRCFNPFHLEPVTIQENIRRGEAGIRQREKTHCKRGHEFTPENTEPGKNPYGTKASRVCRTCRKFRRREAYLAGRG